MKNRWIAARIAVATMAVAGSVAVASPAMAATSTTQAARVASGVGPGYCFTVTQQRDSIGRPQVTVYNNCGDYRRVKVIWNNGPDSGCNEMSVLKTKFSDSSSVTAKYERLVSC